MPLLHEHFITNARGRAVVTSAVVILSIGLLLSFTYRLTEDDHRRLPLSIVETAMPDTISEPEYPSAIGQKFTKDGAVLPFAGNTIICHLPPESSLWTPLRAFYEELEASEFSKLIVMLPPASWHMTVFEGICDKKRTPKNWPKDLPLDASLSECDAFFEDRLKDFDLGMGLPIEMAVNGLKPLDDGIALQLEPVDDAAKPKIRALRDRFADTLGYRRRGHDSYIFHLSISYMLKYLDQHEQDGIQALFERHRENLPKTIKLGAPEFCHFDDMFEFKRYFFINAKE